MAIWQPYKANAHERQKTIKQTRKRLRYCRICGKEVLGSGKYCPSCKDFIERKQHEERRG